MLRRCVYASATLAVFVGVAAAQENRCWSRHDVTGPQRRHFAAMVYDAAREQCILFGGVTVPGGELSAETWSWDGRRWLLLATEGPSPRASHAMTYDSHRQVVILYGGSDDSRSQGDTWEWNGSRWALVATEGPGRRTGHSLAYDSRRARAVLSPDRRNPSETWEWDGASWRLAGLHGPGGQNYAPMVFDESRGVTVLTGGLDAQYTFNFTWEWDGANWTAVSITGPERAMMPMVYDSLRAQCVIFGGMSRLPDRSHHETFAWTGSEWLTLAETGPSKRFAHAMAYDSARDRIVLFGGVSAVPWATTGDTWEFGEPRPELRVMSSCPGGGPIGVEWSGATPRALIALLFAPESGHGQVWNQPACNHITIGLARPDYRLISTARSDALGSGRMIGRIPRRACGGFLEVLDLPTCRVTQAVQIE